MKLFNKCFFKRPFVAMNAITESREGNIKNFGPLGEVSTLTVKLYNVAASAIIALFFLSSPPTVAWLVIAVVVLALYGVFVGWWLAHIGEKVIKRSPAFTDRNTAAAVISKILTFWVFAAGFHCTPNSIYS